MESLLTLPRYHIMIIVHWIKKPVFLNYKMLLGDCSQYGSRKLTSHLSMYNKLQYVIFATVCCDK